MAAVITSLQRLLLTNTYSLTWFLMFCVVRTIQDYRYVTLTIVPDLQAMRLVTAYPFQVHHALTLIACSIAIQIPMPNPYHLSLL